MDKVEQVDRDAASSWADLHGDLSVLGHKLLSALFARHRQQAIAAARPLIEREAWRPIETAPKDGTIILITTYGRTYAAYWSQCPKATGGDKEYPWVTLDETNGVNGLRGDDMLGPLHWMPLPAPPSTAIRALSEKDGQ